jgi:peptidoglycan-N-acetylglucosamine deacetylase
MSTMKRQIAATRLRAEEWPFRNRTDIWLTFDDGPSPRVTERIVETLARFDTQAVFFMCGANAKRYPDLVRGVAEQGHLIGNHSWSHGQLDRLATPDVYRELISTQEVLRDLTGEPCRLFRPPFGRVSARVLDAAHSLQLFPLLWSVAGRDWERPGASVIAERVARELVPGAVILLHDGCGEEALSDSEHGRGAADRTQTADALADILRCIQASKRAS